VIREQETRTSRSLHCVSEYPAPYREMNLRALNTLIVCFSFPSIFRSHGRHRDIDRRRGARCDDPREAFHPFQGDGGAGHKASLEPDEFRKMWKPFETSSCPWGMGSKSAPCEIGNIRIARRALLRNPR